MACNEEATKMNPYCKLKINKLDLSSEYIYQGVLEVKLF